MEDENTRTEQGKKYFHVFRRRKTGPLGRIQDTFPFGKTKDPKTGDVISMDALLYDFDIDWHKLKHDHDEWIKEAIKFLKEDFAKRQLTGGAYQVHIDGYASKTFKGSTDQGIEHNDLLSQAREREVAAKFGFFPPKIVEISTEFHGFNDPPVPGTGECREHRSVRVVVQRPGLPPPKPVDLPTPEADQSTHFKIRFMGGGSISTKTAIPGLDLGANSFALQIWDIENMQSVVYLYVGGNGSSNPVSKVFPFLPPVSITLGSDEWSSFQTTKAIQVTDFDGHLSAFGTVGAGSLTKNAITINGLPNGAVHFPLPIPLETGFGTDVGGSIGPGTLVKFNGPFPFGGP